MSGFQFCKLAPATYAVLVVSYTGLLSQALFACTLLLNQGCNPEPTVQINTEHVALEIIVNAPDPQSFDLSIAANSDCPSVLETAQHTVENIVHEQAFVASSDIYPAQKVGILDPGTYTVQVIGRDRLCIPEAFGCAVFDLTEVDPVSIEIRPDSSVSIADHAVCPKNSNCNVDFGICELPM